MRFSVTAGRSDVGRQRDHNEDAILVRRDLVAVADGMGGHAAGEVASALAIAVLEERADELLAIASRSAGPEMIATIEDLFERIDLRIQDHADREGTGRMGTTLVLAIGAPDGVYIAHCGDSRAYLIRDGSAKQLTVDHSVRNMLLRRGLARQQAESHPAADRLVQALGMGRVEPDVAQIRMGREDTLLLCSDGLSGPVPDREIAAHVGSDLDGSIEELIGQANLRGGPDNISAILVRARSETSARTLARRVERLAKVTLFADLDEFDLWHTAPFLQTRRFRAGDLLVQENTEGHSCLIIVEGSVEVHRHDLHLTTLGPGSHLGEPALIRPWTRSASVTARTGGVAFELSRWSFEELLLARPRIGTRILRALSMSLADRLVDLTDRLERSSER